MRTSRKSSMEHNEVLARPVLLEKLCKVSLRTKKMTGNKLALDHAYYHILVVRLDYSMHMAVLTIDLPPN